MRSNKNIWHVLLLFLCIDLESISQKPSTFKGNKLRIKIFVNLLYINGVFSILNNKSVMVDEAYLDVTDSKICQGSATLIAEQIRADIFNELHLTASAGVAPNKFLVKIASDENKPNGQCVVTPDNISAFVEKLSLKKNRNWS